MAECSYARCVQQRRNIRRELQRWTRNMVHIVGLERIAEELMGRRKWKLYQESMSRSYLQPLNNNVKSIANHQEDYHHRNNNHHHKDLPLDQDQDEQQQQQQNENFLSTKTKSDRDEERDVVEREPEERLKEKENEHTEEDEEDRLKDWTPETKCYFCVDGKLDSEHAAHGVLSPRQSDSDSSDSPSDSEVPPSLTPNNNGRHNNNNRHRGVLLRAPVAPTNMTALESVTSMAALAAAFSAGNSPGTTAPHLPFYSPGLLSHNWYLANVARFQTGDRLGDQPSPEHQQQQKSAGGEQPLDLSKGATSTNAEQRVNNNANNHVVRLPTLDTKHIFNSDFRAKPRMSAVAGRRTYTEDELQAALRDIQSGKLGTRRAAVIYGIPRSTLRNKVYKLALERERESHLNSSTPLKLDEEEAMDDDKELSGAEEEKEVEKALQAPLCDILRFSHMDIPDALKALLLQKNKEGEWSAGMDHSEVGPYIQSLLLASQNLLVNHPKDAAVVPDFVKRMMLAEEHAKNNNGDADKLSRPNSELTKSKSESETDEAPSNVILKIPSYKPTSNSTKNGCDMFRMEQGLVSPPVTSDSCSPPILSGKAAMTIKDVKDVIAQSISQKFQQNLEPNLRRPPPIMEMDLRRGGFTPPLPSAISVIKTQDLTRPYQATPPKPPPLQQQQHSSGSGSSSGQNSGSGGKGTRPKRGKYRNYDRDSLVEAVRAVQRGEMSVHRAGSYYGVPHSTLEYKVKERHLMRPRKRDPKPNPVDEKIASLKQNDLRNSQEKLKQQQPMMKPPQQKFPPSSPNGMKLPMFEGGIPPLGYNPAPFPFWPHPGFHHIPLAEYGRTPGSPFPGPNAEQFFASQMMQKLQEDASRTLNPNSNSPALAKSARQIAESLLDGTGSNGSFLDGIIRSSLESGGPSNESERAKEEKSVGVKNLSNKALLDQLCRNSRLTPLSKPPLLAQEGGGSSSGDEETSYKRTDAASPNNSVGANNGPGSPMGHDLPTIELSNDSNESTTPDPKRMRHETPPLLSDHPNQSTPRIFLKKDLTNPDNLQPELMMRFRDVLPELERNNGVATVSEMLQQGSASSENDAPHQD